jgi:hypothetical protein
MPGEGVPEGPDINVMTLIWRDCERTAEAAGRPAPADRRAGQGTWRGTDGPAKPTDAAGCLVSENERSFCSRRRPIVTDFAAPRIASRARLRHCHATPEASRIQLRGRRP